MRNILTILLVLAASIAPAQNTYLAVYKYHFPSDVAKAASEWQRKHPNTPNTTTGDVLSTDPTFKKMEQEAMRSIMSNQQLRCISSPGAMWYKSEEAGSNINRTPGGGGVISNKVGDGYGVIDYSNWLHIFYNDRGGHVRDTTCYIIDTSQLHFVKTGITKKIGRWNCESYKPASKAYADITYWVCPTLAPYIHPGLYMGIGLNGGVVKVEFKNNKGSITLASLTDTTATIPVQPCPHLTPPRLHNPLVGGFRDY